MPQEQSEPLVEWVTPDIIRYHFNKCQIFEKMKSGEYHTNLRRDSHPENIGGREPYCTRSQIVFYYDLENNLVAVVHQYLRLDGTLGASGLPDPKWLYINNRILALRSEK